MKLLLPILVTAGIGFYISNEQTKIQIAVDQNNQFLQMQLALKEEYYKRRLTVYENACRQIAETKAALDHAGTTPRYEAQAATMMAELDKLRKVNTLYWSPNLEEHLAKLWWLGIDQLRGKKLDDNQFEDALMKLHAQMRQDLQLQEIGKILAGAK